MMQGCRIQLRLANILRQAVAWTSCNESVQLLAASGYQVAAVPAAGHAADRIPLMSGRLVWSELFRQPLSTACREVRSSHALTPQQGKSPWTIGACVGAIAQLLQLSPAGAAVRCACVGTFVYYTTAPALPLSL